MAYRLHGSEYEELGKIDFLLDELARAVERGEVHRDAYDALAPRYLARREEIVAILTGGATVAGESATAAAAPGTASVMPKPAAASAPSESTEWSGQRFGRALPRRSEPVKWTTVLTFLGAFLVVVAAAIFAIAVWDVMGTTGKLAFMGTLTAAFYGAGVFARRKELETGGIALTVVGSAMLLFDGWIAIDGYRLDGPLPWAALLLVCSVVYWATEVVLANRFMGVVGAAAQVGWWWLLGEDLGVASEWRIAGIAVVAAVWSLTAERGRTVEMFASLSNVLRVAACAVAAGSVPSMMVAAGWRVASGPIFSWPTLGAAAIVGISAGTVAWRVVGFAERDARQGVGGVFAALAQVPTLAALASAGVDGSQTWWTVAAAAGFALVYHVVALLLAGASFTVAGLMAEMLAVAGALRILDVDGWVWIAAFAGLAASWALAAGLARRTGDDAGAGGVQAHVPAIGMVAEYGSALLMLPVSLAALVFAAAQGWSGPLEIDSVWVMLAVLAGWYVVAWAERTGIAGYVGTLFAFPTLYVVTTYAAPSIDAVYHLVALVALAGVWLLSAGRMRDRWGAMWAEGSRWTARAGVVALLLVWAIESAGIGGAFMWADVAMVAAAVAFYGLDAMVLRLTVSACAVGVLVPALAWVKVATLMGADVARSEPWGAVGAAGAGLVLGIAAVLVGDGRLGDRGRWAVVASSGSATVLAVMAAGHDDLLVLSLIVVCAMWAAISIAVSEWFVIASVAAFIAAVWTGLSWLDVSSAVGLAVTTVVSALMGAAAWVPALGPGGERRVSGATLTLGGIVMMFALIVAAWLWPGVVQGGAWYALSTMELAVAFAALGVLIVAQAARWHVGIGYYVGGFAWVLSAWATVDAGGHDVVELYSTPLAAYLVAASHLRRWLDVRHRFPVPLDWGAAVVGLGAPLVAGLEASGADALLHVTWVFALSCLAIAAGVLVKSRGYFFGGVAAIAITALYRSFSYLAEYWWLVLGVLGVAMLAIALTWERQRIMYSETRERLRESFEGWR